jgi:hypothetical protein
MWQAIPPHLITVIQAITGALNRGEPLRPWF